MHVCGLSLTGTESPPPSPMPNTATHNIDTVLDGQLYIGKYAFLSHLLNPLRLSFSGCSWRRSQSCCCKVHRPSPTFWHHAHRFCMSRLSLARTQSLNHTRPRLRIRRHSHPPSWSLSLYQRCHKWRRQSAGSLSHGHLKERHHSRSVLSEFLPPRQCS